jgi:hypothetical protein
MQFAFTGLAPGAQHIAHVPMGTSSDAVRTSIPFDQGGIAPAVLVSRRMVTVNYVPITYCAVAPQRTLVFRR